MAVAVTAADESEPRARPGFAPRPTRRPGDRTGRSPPTTAAGSRGSRGGGCGPARAPGSPTLFPRAGVGPLTEKQQQLVQTLEVIPSVRLARAATGSRTIGRIQPTTVGVPTRRDSTTRTASQAQARAAEEGRRTAKGLEADLPAMLEGVTPAAPPLPASAMPGQQIRPRGDGAPARAPRPFAPAAGRRWRARWPRLPGAKVMCGRETCVHGIHRITGDEGVTTGRAGPQCAGCHPVCTSGGFHRACSLPEDRPGHHGSGEQGKQAAGGDCIARAGRSAPVDPQDAGDEQAEDGPLPHEVQQRPAGDLDPISHHASSRFPSCSASSSRISASSSGDAFFAASACITSLAADPPKARSARSRTSCRCVARSERAAR